jgi:DNA helicase-2/ATP-dependent DNA helicase PcrA
MASVPTVEQERGINAGAGLVRIVSGAGTGKTTVLVKRITRLIEEGVHPEHILALSFTKGAANQMKSRVLEGSPDIKFRRASTIHSEANRIFRMYGARVGMEGDNWQIVDGTDTASLFKECVENLVAELDNTDNVSGLTIDALGIDPKDKDQMAELRSFARSRVNNWKERGFSVENLEDTSHENRKTVTPVHTFSLLVYGRFQDRLHAQKLVEISDLIPIATKILEENPDIQKKVSSMNLHVMVDEFQDVNLAQVRFIKRLAGQFNNIVIVGDDDQSMYMFRGSMPYAMRYANILLPEAAAKSFTDITLTRNYRSPERVLEVGNLMVDINPRDGMKILTSGREGPYPKIDSFDNEHVEANVLATRVKAQILAGTPANEISVLSRMTRGLQIIDKVFLAQNIPHRMVSGSSFIERQEVRDILSWVRLALNPGSEIHFDRAAGSPPRGMGERAIALVIKEAQTQKVDCITALQRAIDYRIISGKALTGARDMLDILRDVQSYLDERVEPKRIISELIKRTQYLDWVGGSTIEPEEAPPPQIDMFAAPVSAKKKAEPKKSTKDKKADKKNMEKVERVKDSFLVLMEMSNNATDMMNWMDDLTLADDISSGEDKTPAVHVSTIHASKGLEWDHVHLIGMYQGCLPFNQNESDPGIFKAMENPWSDPLDGCLEEERRLAHVAMTRAKKTLAISYPEVSNQRVNEVSELVELIRDHIPALKPKVKDNYDIAGADFSDAFRTTGGTMRR